MNRVTERRKFDRIKCQIVLPYSVRVPEEEFQFPCKDIKVNLLFRRFLRSNQKDQFKFNQENMIIEKERFGRFDYSVVDISLQRKNFDYSPVTDVAEIRKMVIGIVRKFIQFYVLAYGEYWMMEPSNNDILSFSLKCYDGEEELPGVVGSFIDMPHGNKLINLDLYYERKKHNKSEMLTKLTANFELPIYTKLMMHGDKLCFDESFDVALILYDRAFESFFDILVKIYLMKNKIFDDKWNSYMRMNLVGNNPKRSKLSAYSKAVGNLDKAFDKNEDKFTAWYNDCRSIRNDLVHGRVSDITEEVAHSAMLSVRGAMEFFGWTWIDLLLIDEKYYDKSQNRYHKDL